MFEAPVSLALTTAAGAALGYLVGGGRGALVGGGSTLAIGLLARATTAPALERGAEVDAAAYGASAGAVGGYAVADGSWTPTAATAELELGPSAGTNGSAGLGFGFGFGASAAAPAAPSDGLNLGAGGLGLGIGLKRKSDGRPLRAPSTWREPSYLPAFVSTRPKVY
jgi:hypothetical protein